MVWYISYNNVILVCVCVCIYLYVCGNIVKYLNIGI